MICESVPIRFANNARMGTGGYIVKKIHVWIDVLTFRVYMIIFHYLRF